MLPSSSNPPPNHHAKSGSTPPASTGATGLTRGDVLGALGIGLVVAAAALGIALLTTRPEKAKAPGAPTDHPRRLVEFSLTERSGRPVTQDDLAGKYLVVDFVFTSCSLSCRAVNNRLEEIQRLVAGAPDVLLVSLSVDPRTDTPAVLRQFADGFHADTNRWLFLTGEKAELYRLIETSFIPKSPELEGLVPGGFTHTDRIMLVDPQGNVFASFNGLNRNVATAVTTAIEKHRQVHPPH